jgi:4-carboxymuconolactone decarboxylase
VARLPYINPESEVAQRIRERRGGELRPIDSILLYSPAAADGWNHLLGVLRGELDLAPDLRELAVLRIAVLNRAEYEWQAHEGLGQAAGLTGEQLTVLRRAAAGTDGPPGTFTGAQHAVLMFTDALTGSALVPRDIFAAVQDALTDREVVELTLVVAAYNMVSRFVNALDVGERAPVSTKMPA